MEIRLAGELAGVLCLGWVVLEGVTVRESSAEVESALAELSGRLRAAHPDRPAGEFPGVGDARVLYRAIGVDPTRTRPSSEALLRRVLSGKGLYRVNSLVDAVNLMSLELLLPFGLYDLDRIEGEVEARLGREGEEYEGIGRGTIHVGGRLAMADAKGAFGNPTADSFRTRITLETRRALVVLFAPASCSRERMLESIYRVQVFLARVSGGQPAGSGVVP